MSLPLNKMVKAELVMVLKDQADELASLRSENTQLRADVARLKRDAATPTASTRPSNRGSSAGASFKFRREAARRYCEENGTRSVDSKTLDRFILEIAHRDM